MMRRPWRIRQTRSARGGTSREVCVTWRSSSGGRSGGLDAERAIEIGARRVGVGEGVGELALRREEGTASGQHLERGRAAQAVAGRSDAVRLARGGNELVANE